MLRKILLIKHVYFPVVFVISVFCAVKECIDDFRPCFNTHYDDFKGIYVLATTEEKPSKPPLEAKAVYPETDKG